MPDDERADETPEEETDDRAPHIGPVARFTIGGKPLPLDEFITSTMGALADREPAPPEAQPPGAPRQVVWNSRRPL